MTTSERRFVELRQEGRTLSGVAIVYGSEARIMGFRERFEAGAFGDVSALDVILNRQHQRAVPLARTGGGGLTLTDSETSLRVSADLPTTRAADDVVALVEAKILRGFSLEFVAKRETWQGNLRTISRAILHAVAVVDSPAYPDSAIAVATRHKPSETPQEVTFWL